MFTFAQVNVSLKNMNSQKTVSLTLEFTIHVQ